MHPYNPLRTVVRKLQKPSQENEGILFDGLGCGTLYLPKEIKIKKAIDI